jgi:HEAT repeat protein
MAISEIILTAIADAVFGYLLDKHGDAIGEWIRNKRGRDPVQRAFKKAVGSALTRLQQQHPDWVADLFDASFFVREGAPILAQFLIRNGHPGPSELAARWADSLNLRQAERRTYYIRELEPVASDFLDALAQQLKMQEALRELNDSRALEQLAQDVRAIRKQIEADRATPGTRYDYLNWLIARNLYIDSRGTFQTQRQVQVKLDEVYISLRAQHENPFLDLTLDRWLLVFDELDHFPANPREVKRLLNSWALERLVSEELTRSPQQPTANPDLAAQSYERYRYIVTLLKFFSASKSREASSDIDILVTTNQNLEEHLLIQVKHHLGTPPMFSRSDEALDLAEVVRHYDRLVILGDPGSGKTTLLRYLALKHAQALFEGRQEASSTLGEARFPMLMRVAEYAENGTWKKRALSDFFVECYTLHECPRAGLTDLLQTQLDRGGCLVLLDGLDEIVSADDRRGVVQRIDDFVRHYAPKGNRFVVTSRSAGYRGAPLGEAFARYTVQDMDETQIRLFLERWCQAVEDSQTPELPLQVRQRVVRREVEGIMHSAERNPGVHRLATNPLLLRTLAFIHRSGAQLPQKRIRLYELAAETLARTWRTAQGVPESALVDEHYLTRLLGKLAYWMHATKPSGMATKSEVYRELGQEWARIKGLDWEEDHPDLQREVERFLRAVEEHTGIFVERASGQYSFMHLTFEEYYAARYLVARSATRARLLYQHRHDPRWEEPILLALGFVGLSQPDDAEELLETAILAQGEGAEQAGFSPSLYEALLGRDYLFALRCLVDDIPVRPQVLRKLMARCVDELLHHSGPGRFERYRQILQEKLSALAESKGGGLLASHFRGAAQDDDKDVRVRAVKCLGALMQRDPELVPLLIEVLHRDQDTTVRREVIRILVQQGPGSDQVIAALRSMLGDSSPWLRCEAACGLWQLRQWQLAHIIVETLLQVEQGFMQDDGHPQDAESIIMLALFWDTLKPASEEAVAAVVTLLRDPDANMRQQAAVLLGKAEPADEHDHAIAALRQALMDENSLVRLKAAESLVLLDYSSDDAVAILFDAFRADPSRWLEVIEAFNCLEHLPGEIVYALLALLHEQYTRYTQGRYANQLVELICLLLAGLDYTPDEHALLSEVMAALTEILDGHDAHACLVAAESLGRLSQYYPEAAGILLQAIRETDPSLRSYAAHGLAQAGRGHSTSEPVQALQQALHDPERNVRYQAALSLGHLGQSSPEMIQTLLEALRHAADGQFALVTHFLGEFGPATEQTIGTLVQKLQEDQIGTAVTYVQALVRLGRRFPVWITSIARELQQILENPASAANISLQSDHVYEGLWQLVVGGESGEA